MISQIRPVAKHAKLTDLARAIEFDALKVPWMIEGTFEQYQDPHTCGSSTAPIDPDCFVTTIGLKGSTFVPGFTARDTDWDVRLGLRVLQPKIYIVGSYINRSTNYGYPTMNGAGFGIEKHFAPHHFNPA